MKTGCGKSEIAENESNALRYGQKTIP